VSELAPTITAVNREFWDGVAASELRYQRCAGCAHTWLPAREECPRCLSPDHAWQTSTGRGTLISWVVYHRAFHPEFESLVPYTVAVVELDEGPRMIAGIEGSADGLAIDQPLEVVFGSLNGTPVPRFRQRPDGNPR
jgi:uncharacterized OB-fold protein